MSIIIGIFRNNMANDPFWTTPHKDESYLRPNFGLKQTISKWNDKYSSTKRDESKLN
jgi:hypothetical protein